MTPLPTMRDSRLFRRAICLSSTVGLLLTLGGSSLADYRPPIARDTMMIGGLTLPESARAYTPPSDSRIPDSDHTGGGVRGCGGELAALAPRLYHSGQTLSPRPTFVWYVLQEEPQPLELHLYRYKTDGALEEVFIKDIGQSAQGYMAYSLPSDQADLAVGETYLWQVMLYCDESLEEVDSWSTADIEVVAPSPELTAGLPDAPLQRAETYAQSGYWYDAIATVYDATSPAAKAFRQSLLLDLADLETPPEGEPSIREKLLIDQLRAIATME
ncbi:MAG: DUF928 domain-containing protein [Cyanobacteria bacterium J06636_16]